MFLSAALGYIVVPGCAARSGGGGSVHVPPRSIAYGQTTLLTLELNAWGGGAGKLSQRYAQIQCHYRPEGATTFNSVPCSVQSETADRLVVSAALPSFSREDGNFVEYYFDMNFDGVYNKRPVEKVPLK
jgi:hypothetical protein